MLGRCWWFIAAMTLGGVPGAVAQFALKADMPLSVVGEANFLSDPYLRVQRPAVSGADVKAITAMLELSEEQRQAVQALHDGYAAEYMVEVGKLHALVAAVNRAREANAGDEKAGDVKAVEREHWDQYDRLEGVFEASEGKFLKDVRALLTAEQVERHWAMLERWRRREGLARVSPASMTEWANIDLVKLVEALELTAEEREAVGPLLRVYEIEVDVPLRERASLLREWREKHPEPRAPKDDAFRWRIGDIGRALQNTNKRHVRLIKEALGERGARVEDAARRAAYSSVYEATERSDTVFRELMKSDWLAAEQREKLAALEREHDRDARLLERQQCEALDRLDDAVLKRIRMKAEERRARPFEGDETRYGMMREWIRFEGRTLRAIEGVLSPEQRKKVAWPGGWPWPEE